jgi:hypothetical protein
MSDEQQSNSLDIPIEPLTDWSQAFAECDAINKLVFENQMEQALRHTQTQ